jgi:hypothetical protein
MTLPLGRTLALFLLALLTTAGECADENLVNDPSFDLWCGKQLCSWHTDTGTIRRVPTWHSKDYGVSFESTPAQISQEGEIDGECLRFDMIADVAPEARLSLSLDFNGDGKPEFTEQVPALSWRSVVFQVVPPPSARHVRYSLRKEGVNRAVLAQVRVVNDETCLGDPLTFADATPCSADDECASGACLAGLCSSCAHAGSCADGSVCAADAQCKGGACAGGVCAACARTGSCPAFTPCSDAKQCASKQCVNDERPSMQQFGAENAFVCGECSKDAECASGHCVAATCVSCGDDADCVTGATCRWQDELDARERSCMTQSLEPRGRGGLCDADLDCQTGLHCGASKGAIKRCGDNCSSDLTCSIDPAHEICLSVAGKAHVALDSISCFDPQSWWLNPACVPQSQDVRLDFGQPKNRLHTCYPRRAAGESCDYDGQCEPSADGPVVCCAGRCARGSRDAEGTCMLEPIAP